MPFSRLVVLGLLLLLTFSFAGCGGSNLLTSIDISPCPQAAPSGSTSVPAANHVFLVVEENASYSSVIGNSVMPYLNSLASSGGLATQYFADTHPSVGNYFMLTSGHTITNDDNFSGIVSDDNLVRHLIATGKTWKSYAESLPSVGTPDQMPSLT